GVIDSVAIGVKPRIETDVCRSGRAFVGEPVAKFGVKCDWSASFEPKIQIRVADTLPLRAVDVFESSGIETKWRRSQRDRRSQVLNRLGMQGIVVWQSKGCVNDPNVVLPKGADGVLFGLVDL